MKMQVVCAVDSVIVFSYVGFYSFVRSGGRNLLRMGWLVRGLKSRDDLENEWWRVRGLVSWGSVVGVPHSVEGPLIPLPFLTHQPQSLLVCDTSQQCSDCLGLIAE